MVGCVVSVLRTTASTPKIFTGWNGYRYG